jgi:hypothetical protein
MIQDTIVSQTKPLLEYLKKRQEDKKFLKSIEIAFTFIVVSFFLIFAIKPTATTISALIGEIKSKQILVKEMRAKINNIVIAQDNFSKVQERYTVVESSLPGSPRYYYSANQLRLSSQLSQINLDKLSFNVEENTDKKDKPINPNLESYSVSISQNSDFTSIVDFITRLQDSRRLLDINPINLSLKLSKDKESSPSASGVNFGLNSRLYFWQPNNEKK